MDKFMPPPVAQFRGKVKGSCDRGYAGAAEARIEALTREKTAIEASLADPQVYNGPTAKLQALQVRFGKIKRAIAKAETAWLKAQAAVEAGSR